MKAGDKIQCKYASYFKTTLQTKYDFFNPKSKLARHIQV